jgi:hypothetical protein
LWATVKDLDDESAAQHHAERRLAALEENCDNLLRSLRARAEAMRRVSQSLAAEECDIAADALEGVLESARNA